MRFRIFAASPWKHFKSLTFYIFEQNFGSSEEQKKIEKFILVSFGLRWYVGAKKIKKRKLFSIFFLNVNFEILNKKEDGGKGQFINPKFLPLSFDVIS